MAADNLTGCPDSVTGHAQNDRSGRCCWCGRQVDVPCPRPRMPAGYRTELDVAYRQHWDPDWGSRREDA